jgi:hypothetical protein
VSVAALATFFVLAATLDWLSCAWHRARESGAVAVAVVLAVAIEALGWLPIWFAITADAPEVAVASIAGSAVGTAVGLRRGRR